MPESFFPDLIPSKRPFWVFLIPVCSEFQAGDAWNRQKKISLIGDGVERFLNQPTGLSLHAIRMERHLSIEHLAWSGLKKFLDKKLDFPKPLYLRAPDICIKKTDEM